MMAVKPNGRNCIIKEQIIEDHVTGVTLQFEVVRGGTARLRIFGRFPFGNRTGAKDGIVPPLWYASEQFFATYGAAILRASARF